VGKMEKKSIMFEGDVAQYQKRCRLDVCNESAKVLSCGTT
jgi:hypothetical protein